MQELWVDFWGSVTEAAHHALSPFRTAVEFFVTKLPAAGYLNTTGDAEMDEAESFFRGAAVQGKWKVNGILGCNEAVRLTLFVTA